MTNIERKALALVNEVSDGFHDVTSIYDIHTAKALRSALCRAIEQHEAFRQEVSDAVGLSIERCGHDGLRAGHINEYLGRFIIGNPDPLVEVMIEALSAMGETYTGKELTPAFRAALAKRGLEIREKSE